MTNRKWVLGVLIVVLLPSVGCKDDGMQKPEPTEAAASEVATKAADHLMLSSVNVSITAASDTEISGTFSWQPSEQSDQPKITDGSFRALLK